MVDVVADAGTTVEAAPAADAGAVDDAGGYGAPDMMLMNSD